MAKKKVTETLSKSEKEFLSDIREILKKDLVMDYDKLKEYSEDEIIRYGEYETDLINRIRNTFVEEANNIFQIKRFTEFKQFTNFVDMYQILNGLKQDLEIETAKFVDDARDFLNETIEEDIELILSRIKGKYGATERSINNFKEDMVKRKHKTKDRVMNEFKELVNVHFQDVIKTVDDILEMAANMLYEINDYIKTIEYEDKDLLYIKLIETDKVKRIAINNNLIKVNVLGCYMHRKIAVDVNKEEIKEIEQNLKNIMGEHNIIESDNIKFENGRVMKWNGKRFDIDNSKVTDKSYSYKELNRLAEELGYKLDRSKGDHAIYIQKGKDNVVIPQKVLGKGLQLKILKDLNVI